MKKTKIIGTIGPSSIEYDVMKKLVLAGLNVIRVNLSHAKLEDMEKILANVKRIRNELNVPLPILLDTRGPEIRVKTFENGSVNIVKGQKFIFTSKDLVGDKTIVSLNIPTIIKNIKAGNTILACDGLLVFKVVEVTSNEIITKAQNSGVLSNRKSLFIPGVKLSVPFLNDADKNDILWGIKNGADFVAASFVNSKEDVIQLKNFIAKNGGSMKIISKIESQCGVDNIDEIIKHSDAIMVARGDLGVEVNIERLPSIQKEIIKKVVAQGKTVITATEMLESMIQNKRPTRAEVTDVANAVYDGSSCVMLSGETASGKNPELAVKTMANVCIETEKLINAFSVVDCNTVETVEDVISQSVVVASNSQNMKAIIAHTHSGLSAGLISRFRPKTVIVGATPNEMVYRQLELRWGVMPVLTKEYASIDEMFDISRNIIKELKLANKKDSYIVTCGTPKIAGGTNLMKIDTVE